VFSIQHVDQRISEHIVHFIERELPGSERIGHDDWRDRAKRRRQRARVRHCLRRNAKLHERTMRLFSRMRWPRCSAKLTTTSARSPGAMARRGTVTGAARSPWSVPIC